MPRWKNDLQTSQEVQRLKRDAVMREAGQAFGKRGYHNTSLDDVAKSLGVSKGTLYNYVKDKQEILWEFHLAASAIANRAFAEGGKQGGTGADVLRATLIHYIDMLTEELGVFGALVEVDALRQEDRTAAIELRSDFEKRFMALINAGVKDKSIRPVDPRIAMFAFMGTINWLGRWYSPSGRLTGKEVAESLTDLIFHGLGAAPTALGAAERAPAKARAGTEMKVRTTKPRASMPRKPQAAAAPAAPLRADLSLIVTHADNSRAHLTL